MPLLLVEALERRVDRRVFRPEGVNRLEVHDGALGESGQVLGRKRSLVEQARAVAVVGGRRDRAVVEPEEIVPPRLRPEHQLDAVERPPRARRELEGALEGLDEARRFGSGRRLEVDHAPRERLGARRIERRALDEHVMVRAGHGVGLPEAPRDLLRGVPQVHRVRKLGHSVDGDPERRRSVTRELDDLPEPPLPRGGHHRGLLARARQELVHVEARRDIGFAGELLESLDHLRARRGVGEGAVQELVRRGDGRHRADERRERDRRFGRPAHLFEQQASHSQDDPAPFALTARVTQRAERDEAALDVAGVQLDAAKRLEGLSPARLGVGEALVDGHRRPGLAVLVFRAGPFEQDLGRPCFTARAPFVEESAIEVTLLRAPPRLDERFEVADVFFEAEGLDELAMHQRRLTVLRCIGPEGPRPRLLERAH